VILALVTAIQSPTTQHTHLPVQKKPEELVSHVVTRPNSSPDPAERQEERERVPSTNEALDVSTS
jgi:hypothetical protein